MRRREKPPQDLRRYRRVQERQLVIAVVVAFIVVGSVTIGLVYGWASVITGLLCLLPAMGVFVALWGLLRLLEWIARDRDS